MEGLSSWKMGEFVRMPQMSYFFVGKKSGRNALDERESFNKLTVFFLDISSRSGRNAASLLSSF